MLTYWRVLRGFDHLLLIWLVGGAIVGFSYFGVQSVLLNLYLLRLGFGVEFIGLLVGTSQLIWAGCALPVAAISARIGLGWALVVALTLFALGSGLLLVTDALPREVLGHWLFGCWITFWIGAAFWTVNVLPYAMAVANVEERNYALPFQQAVGSAMALLGSFVGGILPVAIAGWLGSSLADAAPFRLTLWLTVPTYAFGALQLWRGRHVRAARESESDATSGVRAPVFPFVLLGLAAFLWQSGNGSTRAFFNIYLDVGLGVDPIQIGTVMGLAQALPVFASLLVPRLLARIGSVFTFALSCAGLSAALFLLSAVPTWEMAVLGFISATAMTALASPSGGLFGQEIVAPRWRTTSSAVNTIGMGLGWASAAAVGGYLIGSVGFAGLFLVGAVLAAFSASVTLGLSGIPSVRLARQGAHQVGRGT